MNYLLVKYFSFLEKAIYLMNIHFLILSYEYTLSYEYSFFNINEYSFFMNVHRIQHQEVAYLNY